MGVLPASPKANPSTSIEGIANVRACFLVFYESASAPWMQIHLGNKNTLRLQRTNIPKLSLIVRRRSASGAQHLYCFCRDASVEFNSKGI